MFSAKSVQLKGRVVVCATTTLFLVALVPGTALAATIYIEPDTVEVGRSEEFRVDVKIDTEGEEVNTVAVELAFDSRKLRIIDVLDGASVIPLWVERVVDKNGTISLSGVIPGGYSRVIHPETSRQEDGLIASLIFRPHTAGTTAIEIRSASVFANDGKATPVETSAEGASVSIVNSENLKKISSDDAIPPEIIEAKVYEDPSSGDYFLAFYGQDSQSGIAYFEVMAEDGDWESTQNPYYLGKKPHKDLFVKAVDKAGNVAIVKVEAEEQSPWGAVLVAALVLLAALFLSSRKALPGSLRSV